MRIGAYGRTLGSSRKRFGAGLGVVLIVAADVATGAERIETEPNDTRLTATLLGAGDSGAGDIAPVGDHDFWVAAGATASHEIFALVETAQSTSGNTDAVLTVYDDDGLAIVQDQDDGPGLAPAVGGEAVPGGDLFFEVHDLDDDGTITPYRLLQGLFDPSAAQAEIEPNDTLSEAMAVTPDSLISGTISWLLDVDLFAIALASGQEMAVVLDRDPGDTGSSLPSLVDILDTNGATLASGDASSGDVQGVGPITASVAGDYYVRVTEADLGATTAYRMAVLTSVPEPGALASMLVAFGALHAARWRVLRKTRCRRRRNDPAP